MPTHNKIKLFYLHVVTEREQEVSVVVQSEITLAGREMDLSSLSAFLSEQKEIGILGDT